MVSIQNKRRKLLNELEKIDLILNDLSQQRKLLEDRLQQVYCRKYLPPQPIAGDDIASDDVVPSDIEIAEDCTESIRKELSTRRREDDDDEDEMDIDNDNETTDNKEKLRNLFAQLQQF
ncbi:hypothetical protein DERP_010719 [Dermatophagoides pteronyssinus]|uniref:Uncharacterized protein n=1 Tax=Dermatophagoides pteronyssinus TaxID=6956 RepID=A0ABQ8J735_DERPT|nr:hypothetical protein DERP_010719 [Dermatophagoides pteronyssinus]